MTTVKDLFDMLYKEPFVAEVFISTRGEDGREVVTCIGGCRSSTKGGRTTIYLSNTGSGPTVGEEP